MSLSLPQVDAKGAVEFQELYYITPIANVASILNRGLLSHKRAAKITHDDISASSVQEVREKKVVPNSKRMEQGKRSLQIHQYVNLYMRAQNAMMYLKKESREELCVLRIDPAVVRRQGVVFTNRNAATLEASFVAPNEFTFSQDSSRMMTDKYSYSYFDLDQGKAPKRRAVHQSEVLVPKEVHPSFIRGVYVVNEAAHTKFLEQLGSVGSPIPIDLHPSLFFADDIKVPGIGINPLAIVLAQPLSHQNYPTCNTSSPESSDDEIDSDPVTEIVEAVVSTTSQDGTKDAAVQPSGQGVVHESLSSLTYEQVMALVGETTEAQLPASTSLTEVDDVDLWEAIFSAEKKASQQPQPSVDPQLVNAVAHKHLTLSSVPEAISQQPALHSHLWIQMKQGDLLQSSMQTLVNTVNCVGVMGKGIAFSFKRRFPEMCNDYEARCSRNEVKLGEPYCYTLADGRKIINFPTKGSWRENSKLASIDRGLDYMVAHLNEWGVTSLAIPPLGCGLGNLHWSDVLPRIQRAFAALQIPVEIYMPHDTPPRSKNTKEQNNVGTTTTTTANKKQRTLDFFGR